MTRTSPRHTPRPFFEFDMVYGWKVSSLRLPVEHPFSGCQVGRLAQDRRTALDPSGHSHRTSASSKPSAGLACHLDAKAIAIFAPEEDARRNKAPTTWAVQSTSMPKPLDVAFVASSSGAWRVDRISTISGESLPVAARLEVLEGVKAAAVRTGDWILRGVTSNIRYANQHEIVDLASKQAGLSRPEATRAALIPIRKTAAWWDMAQDERRAIFEEQGRHIAIGTEYLPEVARRLHHSRDLAEPFDFLTWFEFAPKDTDAFDDMVCRLRQTPEWRYVDREVDIRLSR